MKYINAAVEDVLSSIFVDKRTVALCTDSQFLHTGVYVVKTWNFFLARLEANVD